MFGRYITYLSATITILSLVTLATASLQPQEQQGCLPARAQFDPKNIVLKLVGILNNPNHVVARIETSSETAVDDLQEYFMQAYEAISNCSQHAESKSDNIDPTTDLFVIVGTAEDFVRKAISMLDAEFNTHKSRTRTRMSTLGDMIVLPQQRRLLDLMELYINYIIYLLLLPEELDEFLEGLWPYTRRRLERRADQEYMRRVLDDDPPGNFWELGRI